MERLISAIPQKCVFGPIPISQNADRRITLIAANAKIANSLSDADVIAIPDGDFSVAIVGRNGRFIDLRIDVPGGLGRAAQSLTGEVRIRLPDSDAIALTIPVVATFTEASYPPN